eukprot:7291118-Prymnesium_polylepis.1
MPFASSEILKYRVALHACARTSVAVPRSTSLSACESISNACGSSSSRCNIFDNLTMQTRPRALKKVQRGERKTIHHPHDDKIALN